MTDQTVHKLTQLTKLEKLWLHDLLISDDSLNSLAQMKSLQELHIYATQISPTGFQDLQKSLPHCRIIHEALIR